MSIYYAITYKGIVRTNNNKSLYYLTEDEALDRLAYLRTLFPKKSNEFRMIAIHETDIIGNDHAWVLDNSPIMPMRIK